MVAPNKQIDAVTLHNSRKVSLDTLRNLCSFMVPTTVPTALGTSISLTAYVVPDLDPANTAEKALCSEIGLTEGMNAFFMRYQPMRTEELKSLDIAANRRAFRMFFPWYINELSYAREKDGVAKNQILCTDGTIRVYTQYQHPTTDKPLGLVYDVDLSTYEDYKVEQILTGGSYRCETVAICTIRQTQ